MNPFPESPKARVYPTAHQIIPTRAMTPTHWAIMDVMLCFLSIPP